MLKDWLFQSIGDYSNSKKHIFPIFLTWRNQNAFYERSSKNSLANCLKFWWLIKNNDFKIRYAKRLFINYFDMLRKNIWRFFEFANDSFPIICCCELYEISTNWRSSHSKKALSPISITLGGMKRPFISVLMKTQIPIIRSSEFYRNSTIFKISTLRKSIITNFFGMRWYDDFFHITIPTECVNENSFYKWLNYKCFFVTNCKNNSIIFIIVQIWFSKINEN